MSATPSFGIITCSYRGDFEACRLLCHSIDRFAGWADHRLIVPRADLALFAPLASSRREIVAAEALQPRWLIGLPLPGPVWRRRLFLPRREVLVSLKGLPVRGWIAQQLRKLAAVREGDWDVVLHVDSDNLFFRDLRPDHIFRDGRVRFFRHPGAGDLPTHRRWHHAAAALLGLADTAYFGADYIDPFVVWQKRHVVGLTGRIEETTGHDWWTALSRTQHFAEYILYGVYVDHVLGENAGHWPTDRSLGFVRWAGELASADDEASFLGEMQPHNVACTLQSTLGLPAGQRQRWFDMLIAKAARQDDDVS